MKSLIFIAPPAAGKGTMAQLISTNYNMPHISTGDLLRDAQDDSERGKYIASEISQGHFVSDELIYELVTERISKSDCDNGYILDGFPRNLEQAKEYENILKKLNKDFGIVIYLSVDKDIAMRRTAGRIVCSKCGAVFNDLIEKSKPKVEGICDKCGSTLVKRADDTPETFIKRFDTYVAKTEPLIKYYEDKKVLYQVDSSKDKDTAYNEIVKILEGFND